MANQPQAFLYKTGDQSVFSSNKSALDVWRVVRATLREECGDIIYSSEISRLRVSEDSAHNVYIICPNAFSRSWAEDHLGKRLRALWATENDDQVIHMCTEADFLEVSQRAESKADLVLAGPVNRADSFKGVKSTQDRQSHLTPHNTTEIGASQPRFTFDTFMVGNSNIMASTVAKAVASQLTPPFNPVFLHGEYGVGKTHLLSAIAHAVGLGQSKRKALFLTAEEFLNGFQSALRARNVQPFKDEVRNCDVLLIDDVQFITGKPATEAEFLQTIMALINAGKQVVLASYYPPTELTVCDLRLRDILLGGFHCPLSSPDLDLRRKVIDCKIAQARQHCKQLDVPESVRDFLAARVTSSARELEGVLNNIMVRTAFLNLPVTLESVEEVIGELPLRAEKRITVDKIQKATASYFNINVEDILSKRRTKTVVHPRHIAMYLAKTMTTRSLPDIGRRFGGRDHSTVIHAIKKISDNLDGDPGLNSDVEAIRRILKS